MVPPKEDIPDLFADGPALDVGKAGTAPEKAQPRSAKHPAPPQKKAAPPPPAAGPSSRSTQVAGSDELALELDYGAPEPKKYDKGGGVDEMEFDPLSVRGNVLDDWSATGRRPSQVPAPALDAVRPANTLIGSSAPDFGLQDESEDEFDLIAATSSRAPELFAAPSTAKHPPHSQRMSDVDARKDGSGAQSGVEIPDLGIPELSPPASVARASVAPKAAQRSVRPPAETAIGELDFSSVPASSSVRPSAAPAGPQGAEAFAVPETAPTGYEAFSGMTGESDLGGAFDDLDFGGSRAAQLDVAVALPKDQDDGVGWPTGQTPSGEELVVTPEEVIEASGYGPVPATILGAPMYAVRVLSGKKPLEERTRLSKQQLSDREKARDDKLAELALSKQQVLEKEERYANLYSMLERHDENIAQKSQVLQTADTEGAAELRDVEAKLVALSGERTKKEKARDEKRALLSDIEHQIGRLRAAVQRLNIDERHLDGRFQKDDMSEAQYYGALAQLKGEVERVEKEIAAENAKRNGILAQVEAAEDQVRLITADYQRYEGTKEGLLMAFEGAISEHSRALDEAKSARRTDLANAGRAILELRGHVPVDKEVRRQLLAQDTLVRSAAHEYEVLKQAVASMDATMFGAGKAMWIGCGVAIFVILALVKFL